MQITFLGTGNAFAPQRDWACILVNDTILLDAGPSALVNMKRLRHSPAQLRHIFISHFHGDHFFGLPFLLLDMYFVSTTEEPLTLIGPPGIEEHVRQMMTLAYPDIMDRGWPRPITFVEAQPEARQTVDGLTFSAVPVRHADDYLKPFAYRLYFDDGILANSGDTAVTPALQDLVAGARVVILEAASQEESTVHLGLRALRELLARMPKDSQVLLNHLDTPDAKAWQDLPVTVPRDLQQFTF